MVRKLLATFVLGFALVPLANAADGLASNLGLQLPNLEASVVYDFTEKVGGFAASSKFLSKGMVEARFGYLGGGSLSETYFVGAGLNLCKMADQFKIDYAWKDTLKVSVGGWFGYDFKNDKGRFGLIGVLLQKTLF